MPLQASQSLKVAHIATPTSGMNLAMTRFKTVVERESNPPLKVEIYPNGEQGGEVEMVERARHNSIQAVLISTAVMANYSPALAAVTLPYLFRGTDSVQSFMSSDVSRELLASLESASLVGLGYCYNNFFNLFIGRRSLITGIRDPSDISGQPFRSGQSDIWSGIIKALGFTPVAVPFPELKKAIESGTVDGCDGIIGLMDQLGYDKLIKSITLSQHWAGLPVFSINKNYMASLGDGNRTLIRNAAQETFLSLVREGVADKENEQAIASFRAKGIDVIALSDDSARSFARRTRVVHENYRDVIDGELLRALYKTCKYSVD